MRVATSEGQLKEEAVGARRRRRRHAATPRRGQLDRRRLPGRGRGRLKIERSDSGRLLQQRRGSTEPAFLGSDAEGKTTANGKTSKTSFVKNGERQQRTEWHRIQAWGSLGEYAAAFRKGSHVCVEGELRSREYESNGVKVRTYDIVAISILDLRAGKEAIGAQRRGTLK